MSNKTSLPPANAHFISTQQAVSMTALYRQNREAILAKNYIEQNILALSETFNRDAFDELLSKPGCAGIRIYYGMDEALKVHAIAVAVDENNSDILPNQLTSEVNTTENFIAEEGQRCPNICPTASPLNS